MADTLPDDPVARAKAIALKLTATTSAPADDKPAGDGTSAPASESGSCGSALMYRSNVLRCRTLCRRCGLLSALSLSLRLVLAFVFSVVSEG